MSKFDRRHFVGAAFAMTATASTALFARSNHLPHRQASSLAPVRVPAAPKHAEMPPLLQKAMAALDTHARRLSARDRIGVVDFSQASREKRFQLIDVEGGKVERTLLVAHGKGSDLGNSGYVQRFSNQPGSNASSRGAYCTANRYYGKHGSSQRLMGLDPENDAALERAIVIHGASYVDPLWIDSRGRIGRSFGCFALEDGEVERTMDWLGEGRLLYADKLA